MADLLICIVYREKPKCYTSIWFQVENYQRWEEEREKEYQKQVDAYRKRQLMEEIESKKEDLSAREEVIFFFDNKEKLEMLLPSKKKKYAPVFFLFSKYKKQDLYLTANFHLIVGNIRIFQQSHQHCTPSSSVDLQVMECGTVYIILAALILNISICR